jgi:hypothetical protein
MVQNNLKVLLWSSKLMAWVLDAINGISSLLIGQ